MENEPYEPPNTRSEHVEEPDANENLKELLGIAGDDFWAYPGLALLGAAWFVSRRPDNPEFLVPILLVLSTVFVLIFLCKSFPKYRHSKKLSKGIKAFGFIGNIGLIIIQAVAVVLIYLLRVQ